MARSKTAFVCRACGHSAAKWLGRCPGCREWNTLHEQVSAPPSAATMGEGRAVPLAEVSTVGGGEVRLCTGIAELDRPLGGGLVSGSLVLIGGDPGVGKSTLLLEACEQLARRGLPVLYVTGEESVQQVKLRADRLGAGSATLHVLASTAWPEVEAAVRQTRPVALVVDSVQTVHVPEVSGIPGSVKQVREVAHHAMRLAKGAHVSTFLVGHITKSGDIAGPKLLEHLVDTVLYFEGDGRSTLRVLRSVKNRFGAAGELGMFEMGDDGLRQVPDASARLLGERSAGAPGTAVVASLEGTRPLLVEVQALVGRPGPQTPARTCVGVDRNRVSMLCAVLQKAGLPLHDRDVYVNAAGGLRLLEPAIDLAIVAAVASSLHERALADDTLLFGEVGLVGEVRAVSNPGARLREAARHGFRRVVAPASTGELDVPGLQIEGVRRVRDALAVLMGHR